MYGLPPYVSADGKTNTRKALQGAKNRMMVYRLDEWPDATRVRSMQIPPLRWVYRSR